MATGLEPEASAETQHDSYLSQLRSTAQAHLDEIEIEKIQEAEQQNKGEEELRRYSKRKTRKTSPSLSNVSVPSSDGKGPRLRSAHDVLHRLRWDPSIKISEYHIGYLERFEGLKEMPVTSWISEFTDEDWIPQHRIKYVKRMVSHQQQDDSENEVENEIVWDREARIDKIFGSGGVSVVSDESIDGSIIGGVVI